MPVSFVLQEFADNIWIADGPKVTSFGFCYGTRMAVIKLPSGGLFVWSPVALTEDLKKAVESFGPVEAVIAPNSLHHLFVPQWQSAYPEARIFGAPGLHKRRPDIEFDATLSDTPDPLWADTIDQVVVEGNILTTEVVFFHRESKTVLFTDLIQNFPTDWFTGWRKIIAKVDNMIGDEPQVPRKFRLAFTNRKIAKTALTHILQWPADRVLMAHGTPVHRNGAELIRQAFCWLTK